MNEAIFYLESHPLLTSVICSVAGYLIGSLSSARIVWFLATGSRKIEPFAEPVPHSDETFESDLVSATLITKKLGARFGCITSVTDMLKAAIPTLLAKMVLTTEPWYLLVALFVVIGHNLPLYYRFHGGRGESPIIGSLFVINWFGLIITNLGAFLLSFITGSVLVMRWGAYVLMIFWLWYYFHDWRYGLFMTIVNFFFWFSQRNDLMRFSDLKKNKGLEFSEEDVSEFILMGKAPGRMLDRYSLPAFFKRMSDRNKKPGK